MQSSKVLWQFDGRLCYNVNQMHVCVCCRPCCRWIWFNWCCWKQLCLLYAHQWTSWDHVTSLSSWWRCVEFVNNGDPPSTSLYNADSTLSIHVSCAVMFHAFV